MKRYIILAVMIGLLPLSTWAQGPTSFEGKSLDDLKAIEAKPIDLLSGLQNTLPQELPKPLRYRLMQPEKPHSLPLAYAYKDLAVFCKLEVKMEKVVKMPIKVRLGSVDYVDWLEGKRDKF